MSTGTKLGSSQEELRLNPCAVDVNLESSDGTKHFIKATEEQQEKIKIKAYIVLTFTLWRHFTSVFLPFFVLSHDLSKIWDLIFTSHVQLFSHVLINLTL